MADGRETPRGECVYACVAAHPSQTLAADTGRYCSALGRRQGV